MKVGSRQCIMAAFLKRRTGRTQSQPGLNLDTEILQKNENISTSLCDRFGIHMYTSEFMEQEKAYQEEQEEKNNEIFLNVLNNPEKEITETAFQRVMQADTTAVIKTEYNENNETNNQYMNIAYGIFGAILAGVVLFFIEKYRRKRNENHHNNQK